MMIQKPEAVIFDWDGTLTSSEALINHAFQNTLSYMNADHLKNQLGSAISARDFFQLHFGENAEKASTYFYQQVTGNHINELSVIDGADTLLDLLHKSQIPMFILSNKRGDLLRKEIEHLGWTPYFQKIVGSTDGPADKPAPESVDFLFSGTPFHGHRNIWFVGDTIVDLECAHRSDCFSVLMNPIGYDSGAYTPYAPDLAVPSCEDLQKKLFSLL